MHIRLHGTPAENRAVLANLGEKLDIRTVSKPTAIGRRRPFTASTSREYFVWKVTHEAR